MSFPKILKNTTVFLIIFAWVFSGWPQIWPLGESGVDKVRIPPEIYKAQAADTVVILTTGTSWTVPDDWTATNTIEVIGGGGGGQSNAALGAAGGGGGAYSKISNITSLSGSITISIGAGGGATANGGDTYFNGSSCTGSSICAKGGLGATSATGALGGAAADGVGTTKYSGGTGGDGQNTGDTGGGGGGAGGPNGNGATGGAGGAGQNYGGGGGGGNGNGYIGSAGTTSGGNGGNNYNNTGGGAGGNAAAGGNGTDGGGGGGGDKTFAGGTGGNGIEWTSAGSGGGGGGAGDNGVGGNGGLYGAGGGGGSTGGSGAQGIIVITYTPANMTVGTTGTQTATTTIPFTDFYVGGAFTFVRDAGTATTTQIIITDAGTVDANANLSNVDLYYETAATCTYDANETLFGTAASFDSSEKATITGTMLVGTSQVCLYIVLDVGSGAAANDTIEIEITNPSTEIIVSNGTVSPATVVQINGTTTLEAGDTVSCNVVPASTDFGELTISSVHTSNPNTTTTISTTYSAGFTLYVKDAGAGAGQPGLYSTSTTKLISSVTDSLTAGTEGYGIQAATTTAGSGATVSLNSTYLKTGNDVGALSTSNVVLASSTASCTDREVVTTHKAAISELTAAASDYADTITYSCSGN